MVSPLAPNLDIHKFIRDIYERPEIWDRKLQANKPCLNSTWTELENKHNHKAAVLKAKWKGLRDNFRVEFKRIPRDENGYLMIKANEYKSKWGHYKDLLFLTDHMRSRDPKSDYNGLSYRIPAKIEKIYAKSEQLIQIPDYYEQMCYESPNVSLNGIKLNMGILQSSINSIEPETIECRPLLDINGPTPNKRFREDKNENDDEQCRSESSSPRLNGNTQNTAKDDDDYHFLMSLHPYMSGMSLSRKLQIRMKIQKIVFDELYENCDI